MSKSVLISIKPQWCELIASSAKKMTEDELREMVSHYEELCKTDVNELMKDEVADNENKIK